MGNRLPTFKRIARKQTCHSLDFRSLARGVISRSANAIASGVTRRLSTWRWSSGSFTLSAGIAETPSWQDCFSTKIDLIMRTRPTTHTLWITQWNCRHGFGTVNTGLERWSPRPRALPQVWAEEDSVG